MLVLLWEWVMFMTAEKCSSARRTAHTILIVRFFLFTELTGPDVMPYSGKCLYAFIPKWRNWNYRQNFFLVFEVNLELIPENWLLLQTLNSNLNSWSSSSFHKSTLHFAVLKKKAKMIKDKATNSLVSKNHLRRLARLWSLYFLILHLETNRPSLH